MSGHRKFSELTKGFTPEDRKVIEEEKAAMRAALQQARTSSKVPTAVPKAHEPKSRAASGR